jgi:hypothetical protein
MTGTDLTSSTTDDDSEAGRRQPNEVRAVSALACRS